MQHNYVDSDLTYLYGAVCGMHRWARLDAYKLIVWRKTHATTAGITYSRLISKFTIYLAELI